MWFPQGEASLQAVRNSIRVRGQHDAGTIARRPVPGYRDEPRLS